MQRRAVLYSGRVQGVGFRATTRAIARRYRVTGWVRNEPDGGVRLEVQGPPEEVEAMLRALADRMHGHITSARTTDLPPTHEESAFEIRG